MSESRKSYPSDVTDDEWSFVVRYLALRQEGSGQRVHDLCQVLNGLRHIVKTGAVGAGADIRLARGVRRRPVAQLARRVVGREFITGASYHSDPRTSPPLGVTALQYTASATPRERTRTLPSARAASIPPACGVWAWPGSHSANDGAT